MRIRAAPPASPALALFNCWYPFPFPWGESQDPTVICGKQMKIINTKTTRKKRKENEETRKK
jgi:hypothetical protein